MVHLGDPPQKLGMTDERIRVRSENSKMHPQEPTNHVARSKSNIFFTFIARIVLHPVVMLFLHVCVFFFLFFFLLPYSGGGGWKGGRTVVVTYDTRRTRRTFNSRETRN